jgi:hypothetical protein
LKIKSESSVFNQFQLKVEGEIPLKNSAKVSCLIKKVKKKAFPNN